LTFVDQIRDCPLLDADHTDTLVKISKETSVLIIWGEDDGILPHTQLNEFKKHVEHAELFSIPKTHHAAFLQKPQLVFDAIMNFVQKESTAKLVVAV
jgi:pimeloyl-ACP methyl ester carboxylesterase